MLPVWSAIHCPVIGMLHLPPLPGSPRASAGLPEICEFVLRDAEALACGGVDGLMLENFGDWPFFPGRVETATVASMTLIAAEVRRRFDLPLGINVLRNDGLSALAIAAAVGGQFIRVNVLSGARVTDQGLIQGIAHDLLRERARLRATDVRILADVNVKHSAPLASRPMEEEVADLAQRAGADALIVTGAATGSPAGLVDVTRVKKASERLPVLIGSGVSTANIATFLPIADGLIVGSAFKQDGCVSLPIDQSRVRELMQSLRDGKS